MIYKKIWKEWLVDVRPRVVSKFAHEFIGCMLFHFLGSVGQTPVANAVALMVLVYYTAKTSDAHLNPALSLTFSILGYTNPLELLFYWAAQISGAAMGAMWLALLVPDIQIRSKNLHIVPYQRYDGCFLPRQDLSYAQIFGWEAFATFAFIVPIFSVVWYTLRKRGYGNTGPLMIGLSLYAAAAAANPFTGAALNPARVLGSPIVFDCRNRDFLFYYIIGELVGALLVPLVIIPWYGIAREAWYLDTIPFFIKKRMKLYQPSLRIKDTDTINTIDTIQAKPSDPNDPNDPINP